jgi:hypothetical protein
MLLGVLLSIKMAIARHLLYFWLKETGIVSGKTKGGSWIYKRSY